MIRALTRDYSVHPLFTSQSTLDGLKHLWGASSGSVYSRHVFFIDFWLLEENFFLFVCGQHHLTGMSLKSIPLFCFILLMKPSSCKRMDLSSYSKTALKWQSGPLRMQLRGLNTMLHIAYSHHPIPGRGVIKSMVLLVFLSHSPLFKWHPWKFLNDMRRERK